VGGDATNSVVGAAADRIAGAGQAVEKAGGETEMEVEAMRDKGDLLTGDW
jgi:hypothetical protein